MKYFEFFRYLENEENKEIKEDNSDVIVEDDTSVINISRTNNENLRNSFTRNYKRYFPKLNRASLTLDALAECTSIEVLKSKIAQLGDKPAFSPLKFKDNNSVEVVSYVTYQPFLLENTYKSHQCFDIRLGYSAKDIKTFNLIDFDLNLQQSFKSTIFNYSFNTSFAGGESFFTPFTFVVIVQKDDGTVYFRFLPVQLEYNSILGKFTAIKFSKTQDIPEPIIKAMDNLLVKNISQSSGETTNPKVNQITKSEKGSVNPLSVTWTDTQRTLVLDMLNYSLADVKFVQNTLGIGKKRGLIATIRNPKVKIISALKEKPKSGESYKEKTFKVPDRLLKDDVSLGIDELFFTYNFEVTTTRTLEENPMLLEELEKEITGKFIDNNSVLESAVINNNKLIYGYYKITADVEFITDKIILNKIKDNLFSVEVPLVVTKTKTRERALAKAGRGTLGVLGALGSTAGTAQD